jgi:DNA-directed RNA polymerase subunit K/omega
MDPLDTEIEYDETDQKIIDYEDEEEEDISEHETDISEEDGEEKIEETFICDVPYQQPHILSANSIQTKYKINKESRTTRPYISKFEKTRILSIRVQQLKSGCKPLLNEDTTHMSAYEIAEKEFKLRKIPLIIRRDLFDGGYEEWEISELIDLNTY